MRRFRCTATLTVGVALLLSACASSATNNVTRLARGMAETVLSALRSAKLL